MISGSGCVDLFGMGSPVNFMREFLISDCATCTYRTNR